MISRITRNFVGLTMWCCFTLGFFFIASVTGLGNYLGTSTSLDMLNHDRMPLWEDKLLGLFFSAFLGEASVAHLLALGLTLTIAAGWFFVTNIIFHLYSLFRDRKQYINEGDMASAQAALELMVADVIMLVIIGIPLLLACWWDISLFRYRSAVAALGIEEPQVATRTVLSWRELLRENGRWFAFNLARFGGWGYVAVTALASIGIDFSFKKVAEYWSQLCNAFSELWKLEPDGPDGPDPNDPDPIQAEAVAEASGPVSGSVTAPEPFGQQSGPVIDDPHQPQPTSPDEPQDVIGGDGERVTLADAHADPRYWINPATREIWDAAYRNSVANDGNGGQT